MIITKYFLPLQLTLCGGGQEMFQEALEEGKVRIIINIIIITNIIIIIIFVIIIIVIISVLWLLLLLDEGNIETVCLNGWDLRCDHAKKWLWLC